MWTSAFAPKHRPKDVHGDLTLLIAPAMMLIYHLCTITNEGRRMHIVRFTLAATLSLTLAGAACAAVPSPAMPQLREELLAMEVQDQQVRDNLATPDYQRWTAVDASNGRRLKEIVAAYGWPTFAMVGEDGASAAWILAQHADADPAFQTTVLALMAPLVEQGQASAKLYAYLHDRTHQPQRFGTQGRCVSAGHWEPFEIEDLPGLSERRRKAGMPSMQAYAEKFKSLCKDWYHPEFGPENERKTIPLPQE